MALNSKIIVNKKMMPYRFNISFDDTGIYSLLFNYNEKGDFFTIALYKNGELISGGQPINYGVPLFLDVFEIGKFPAVIIKALDESNNTDVVTWDNFGEIVFLCIDDRAPDEVTAYD